MSTKINLHKTLQEQNKMSTEYLNVLTAKEAVRGVVRRVRLDIPRMKLSKKYLIYSHYLEEQDINDIDLQNSLRKFSSLLLEELSVNFEGIRVQYNFSPDRKRCNFSLYLCEDNITE